MVDWRCEVLAIKFLSTTIWVIYMKSFFIRLLAAGLLTFPTIASAQSGPVVVELFTSQGCSSCPPADDYLAGLVGRDDVLPLAFHVDYWDRLGWKDTFATPEYTARQYAYGRAFKNRSVWTPQFVVGGVAYSRGSFRDVVSQGVKEISSQPEQVSLSASVQGGKIVISAKPLTGGLPKMLVSVVGYTPKETVQIKRGENAGKTISYHNTVNFWSEAGRWDGRGAANLSVPANGAPPYAVIVQAEGHGPIVAAAFVK